MMAYILLQHYVQLSYATHCFKMCIACSTCTFLNVMASEARSKQTNKLLLLCYGRGP